LKTEKFLRQENYFFNLIIVVFPVSLTKTSKINRYFAASKYPEEGFWNYDQGFVSNY